VRGVYLACDAAAIRAAWTAAMSEGAVSEDLGTWRTRCLICVAADDVDFFDQARRAADKIPERSSSRSKGPTTSALTPCGSIPCCLRS